ITPQSVQNKGASRLIAPDQFQDDVDVGVRDDFVELGALQFLGHGDVPRSTPIFVYDFLDPQLRADLGFDLRSVFLQKAVNPLAHGAETDHTDLNNGFSFRHFFFSASGLWVKIAKRPKTTRVWGVF